MPPPARPEQIRASIEANRSELAHSLGAPARRGGRADRLARAVVEHQKQVLIGAAAAGFVLGGGIAGVVGLFRRRR